MAKNKIQDPLVDNMPAEWSNEKKIIARDAMIVLHRHFSGWKWGIEFNDDPSTGGLDSMVVRLTDIMTETAYLIHAKDIDRDRMHCVMIAGGMLLEAHGLSRSRNRHDEVRGLATTPAGLLVPYADAVPVNNPGYDKIKQQNLLLR